jgi:hypothetical protein
MILSKPINLFTVQQNSDYFIFKLRLKGQCHEIVDLWFFHQSTPPRALTHMLKPFRIWLRIRRENRHYSRKRKCHWHRWNRFSRLSKWLSRRIRSHMRNGFSLWVRALGGVDWWKKTRGRKSRDTVPLTEKRWQLLEKLTLSFCSPINYLTLSCYWKCLGHLAR